MRLSTEIKPFEELGFFKRSVLFNDAHKIVKEISLKYKARHKLIDALKAKGIYYSISEKYVYLSRDFTKVELYIPWGEKTTVPEILALFDDRKEQYQYKEFDKDYEPSLYNAEKDIQNSLSGEMTQTEFNLRCKGLALALRNLAAEVESLDVAEYVKKESAS